VQNRLEVMITESWQSRHYLWFTITNIYLIIKSTNPHTIPFKMLIIIQTEFHYINGYITLTVSQCHLTEWILVSQCHLTEWILVCQCHLTEWILVSQCHLTEWTLVSRCHLTEWILISQCHNTDWTVIHHWHSDT